MPGDVAVKRAAWVCDACGEFLGMQSSVGLFLVNERVLRSFHRRPRDYVCDCPECGARNVWHKWREPEEKKEPQG